VKRACAVVVILGGVVGAPPAASAATPFAPCGPAGLQCATLNAPVDYSGATLGQVPLYVEQLPAEGVPRGVMVLLAGGPGQASAGTFELGRRAAYWRSYFPGYTLVAYDDRGTGKSGPLSCPFARTIADCGAAIPNRTFYSTRDHAEDVESVRLALGVDKVGIFGVSYGAKHAVAYALAHPDRVERLLLESTVLPERDTLGTESLRSITSSINRICAVNACPAIAGGIGDRFAQLANTLETSPITATLRLAPALAPFPVEIDGSAMLSLAFDSDLSSAVSSQLPAAVDAALAGRPEPLERLVFLATLSRVAENADINGVLLLTTTCNDGPFPWQPNDTPEARRTALAAAVAAIPPASIAPLGPWAVQTGSAFFCIDWPSPSGGAALAPGPLPDVPVLVLAGDRDIRTPAAAGAAIAARFPQGHLVVVPGAGHSVLNHSDCAAAATRGWLNGAVPPATCTTYRLAVPPLGTWRRSVAAMPPVARVGGLHGRTLAALVQTLHEAEDVWLLTRRQQPTLVGVAGGRVTPYPNGVIRLQAYSALAGLAVTGTIKLKLDPYGSPIAPLTAVSGSLTLSGRSASHGTLRVAGNRLTGTLAGRAVAATF
jgi:pimeloyl-ACP methyl ester carboxylesterase